MKPRLENSLPNLKISFLFQKMLDDPNISQSDKIDILNWFDQFEYRTFTLQEALLEHAKNLNF